MVVSFFFSFFFARREGESLRFSGMCCVVKINPPAVFASSPCSLDTFGGRWTPAPSPGQDSMGSVALIMTMPIIRCSRLHNNVSHSQQLASRVLESRLRSIAVLAQKHVHHLRRTQVYKQASFIEFHKSVRKIFIIYDCKTTCDILFT